MLVFHIVSRCLTPTAPAFQHAQNCLSATQVFYEVFAHRDFITYVLDDADRRNEQLAALGGAICRNELTPAEFTPLLGSGLDGEAAVAAYEAQRGN